MSIRTAWIQFACAALSAGHHGCGSAAEAADAMLDELVRRYPELRGELNACRKQADRLRSVGGGK